MDFGSLYEKRKKKRICSISKEPQTLPPINYHKISKIRKKGKNGSLRATYVYKKKLSETSLVS